MGTDITSWDAFMEAMAAGEASGAMYVGAGGWEWFWLVVSIVICGVSLFMGFAHEKLAYRRAAKK